MSSLWNHSVEQSALRHTFGDAAFRGAGYSWQLALSPDGRELIVPAQSRWIVLDARTGAPIRFLDVLAPNGPGVISYSGDGTMIVAQISNGAAAILRREDGSLLRTIAAGNTFSNVWVPSPAAPLLYAGGSEGHSHLWDLRDGSIVAELPFWEHHRRRHRDYTSVIAASWSPDGTRLLTLTHHTADLWEPSATHLASLAHSGFMPTCATWSPDGSTLYLASHQGQLLRFDARTGAPRDEEPAASMNAHISALFASADGEHLIALASNDYLHWIDADSLSVLQKRFLSARISQGALSPEGDMLYLNGNRGAVVRVEISSLEVITPPAGDAVQGISFDDSGRTLTAVRAWGSVERASLETGAYTCEPAASRATASLSPKARYASTSDIDRDNGWTLLALDADAVRRQTLANAISTVVDDDGMLYGANAASVLRLPLDGPVRRIEAQPLNPNMSLALSPDGRWLAAHRFALIVRVDLTERSPIVRAKVVSGSTHAIDARGVMVCTGKTNVMVIEESGRVRSFPGGIGSLSAVAVTDDGALIAAGSNDGEVVLLRPDDPKRARSFRASPARITRMAFSRDGAQLAIGGTDPLLRVYDVAALIEALTAPKPAKKRAKKT